MSLFPAIMKRIYALYDDSKEPKTLNACSTTLAAIGFSARLMGLVWKDDQRAPRKFSPTPREGPKFRIMGIPVYEDESIPEGVIRVYTTNPDDKPLLWDFVWDNKAKTIWDVAKSGH